MQRLFLSLVISIPLTGQPRMLISAVRPEYTPEARQSALQGTVRVKLQVTPRGKIADAKIERGLGLGLDQEALRAVKQWVYADVSHVLRRDEVITLSVPFLLDPPGTWKVTGSVFRLTDPASGEVRAPELAEYSSPENGMCLERKRYVAISLDVGKDGSPEAISAASTGDEAAEQAALKAAQSWRFHPATLNGSKRASTGKILLECSGPTAGDGDDASSPAVKVGKNVSRPSLIFKVEPEYSAEARQARFQGDVQISAIVETSGRLSNVRILKPLGLGLDQHVLAAVSQWRFKPALKDGQPVRVVAQITVNFRLL